jgi:hypothetical protein
MLLIALSAGWGLASVAHAQEAPKPVQPGAPAPPPDINMLLIRPFGRIDSEPFKREDLDRVPPPKPDRLSESIRVTVTIGDPRCEPGDDDPWQELARSRTRLRRPIR